jgi:hypothetical protein
MPDKTKVTRINGCNKNFGAALETTSAAKNKPLIAFLVYQRLKSSFLTLANELQRNPIFCTS